MTMKDATGFSIERERNNFSWLLTEQINIKNVKI